MRKVQRTVEYVAEVGRGGEKANDANKRCNRNFAGRARAPNYADHSTESCNVAYA